MGLYTGKAMPSQEDLKHASSEELRSLAMGCAHTLGKRLDIRGSAILDYLSSEMENIEREMPDLALSEPRD